jgi:hypothetical protein
MSVFDMQGQDDKAKDASIRSLPKKPAENKGITKMNQAV